MCTKYMNQYWLKYRLPLLHSCDKLYVVYRSVTIKLGKSASVLFGAYLFFCF